MREVGGHIGYDMRPSARCRGHATAMLRAALPVAGALGIDQALITCDADNVGSRRVIERNGGILEDQRGDKLRLCRPALTRKVARPGPDPLVDVCAVTPEQRRNELRAAELSGQTWKVLPFWGHKPTASGELGAGCLSQWWPATFTVDGVPYPTAEHWMMAGKARLFEDPAGLAAVQAARSPGAAKAAGRKVRGFDQERWVAARFDLVVAGNLAKFSQHTDLGEFLLTTGARVLVEASPYDRIWGVGLAPTDPQVLRVTTWRGLNLLGFALMEVRDQLRLARDNP